MWGQALDVLAGVSQREKLVVYPMGELPPPPLEPLGPIAIDMGDGRGMLNLRGKSLAEKEAIMANRPIDGDAPAKITAPKMKRM